MWQWYNFPRKVWRLFWEEKFKASKDSNFFNFQKNVFTQERWCQTCHLDVGSVMAEPRWMQPPLGCTSHFSIPSIAIESRRAATPPGQLGTLNQLVASAESSEKKFDSYQFWFEVFPCMQEGAIVQPPLQSCPFRSLYWDNYWRNS